MRRLLSGRTFAAIAAICVLSACGSTPKPLPQLTQDMRSSLGTVGVITIGPAVGGKVDGPVGGVVGQAVVGGVAGGVIGAGTGIGAGLLLGSLACGPAAGFCALGAVGAGLLTGLVGGSAYGGINRGQNAIPSGTVEEIQTALTGAISDRDLQADLRRRVLQHPGNPVMRIDLGEGAIVPVVSPDYASFTSRGTSTVLEMSLTQLVFTGEGGRNPTLALVITGRARLIRIADKRVLWNVEQVRYESSATEFSSWTASDSGLLKSEIDSGLEAVARQIGEALFGAPGTLAHASEPSWRFFAELQKC